jgi:hypothetical protein
MTVPLNVYLQAHLLQIEKKLEEAYIWGVDVIDDLPSGYYLKYCTSEWLPFKTWFNPRLRKLNYKRARNLLGLKLTYWRAKWWLFCRGR